MSNHGIQFYFDPISPYAWLAGTQLDRIKHETGLHIELIPILFAGLLKAHGHKGPAEIAAKREYTFRDVLRRAHVYGLQVKGAPAHPFNPLLALRACVAITDPTMREQFAVAIMNGCWRDGLDITSASVLTKIAEDNTLSINIEQQTQDAAVKQKLIDNTNAAIERGLFGVPTFCIDNELFWGDDRIGALLRYIRGERIDTGLLASILSRPAAVKREA